MGHDLIGREELYFGYSFKSDFLYNLNDCYERNREFIRNHGKYELQYQMAEELSDSWEKFATEHWKNYNFPNLNFYFFYTEYIAAYESYPSSEWYTVLGYKSGDFKQARTSDDEKDSTSITLDFPINCLEVLVSFIQKVQTEQRELALSMELKEKPISNSDDLKKKIHFGMQPSVSKCAYSHQTLEAYTKTS